MFYRSVFVLLSFGHCIVCPSVYADYPFGVMFYRSKDRQYNDQKIKGQTLIYKTLHQRGNQRKPKDRQYNDQKIKGQTIIYKHCIVCPSVYADYPFGVMFYRSLLVLYLLVIVLSVLRFTLITPLVSLVCCVMFYRSVFVLLSFCHQKIKGQTLIYKTLHQRGNQRKPKDRQYNDQKIKGQTIIYKTLLYRSLFALLSFGHCIVCPSVYADYPFGVMFYRSVFVLLSF
jgi:hypothetical protein